MNVATFFFFKAGCTYRSSSEMKCSVSDAKRSIMHDWKRYR